MAFGGKIRRSAMCGSLRSHSNWKSAYRNLRSALLHLAVEGQRPKVVLITSAVPNEGKSTIVTNLARALAFILVLSPVLNFKFQVSSFIPFLYDRHLR
jgi:hypothetical protein